MLLFAVVVVVIIVINIKLQQLLCKLRCCMPDNGYQEGLLNYLELGSGKSTDAHLLLTKNKMKEVCHAFSYIVEQEFGFSNLLNDVKGIQCRLEKACLMCCPITVCVCVCVCVCVFCTSHVW